MLLKWVNQKICISQITIEIIISFSVDYCLKNVNCQAMRNIIEVTDLVSEFLEELQGSID